MFLIINHSNFISFLNWYESTPSIVIMIITFIVLSFVFGYFKDKISKVMNEPTPLWGLIFLAFCFSVAWIFSLVLVLILGPAVMGNFIGSKFKHLK